MVVHLQFHLCRLSSKVVSQWKDCGHNWQVSIAFHCMISKAPPIIRILRILRILQDFKSQEWTNTSQFSLPPSNNPPKKIWIQDDTSASTIVHRPLETSQAPWPHRLEWRFPEPAKQRKRPANVIPNGCTSCSTSVPCENTAGQKQRQKDGAIRLFSSKPMENPIV